MGSKSVSSDHIEQTQAIPRFVYLKPQLTYIETDLDVSMELVDIEFQGLSDIDGILVKPQAIPMKLTKAQNATTLTTAPAKIESAIDNDQFSLTSGLTESVRHLAELKMISDLSLWVVNIGSIPEIVLQATLSYDKDNICSISIY